jgi:hypothetical protein
MQHKRENVLSIRLKSCSLSETSLQPFIPFLSLRVVSRRKDVGRHFSCWTSSLAIMLQYSGSDYSVTLVVKFQFTSHIKIKMDLLQKLLPLEFLV